MSVSVVTYKHYCRICNKGFGCGPALGGHMRAHGIANNDEHYPFSSNSKRTSTGGGSSNTYGLRSNSNRICDNCGKDFLSLESFINHGKHNSDSDDDGKEEEPLAPSPSPSSPKRLRRNNNLMSSHDEDLANCLMLLSSSSRVVDSEESCESASKSKSPTNSSVVPIFKAHNNNNNSNLMFECKACKKVFSSHQALGGHRASHKKVKGCFASKLDCLEEEEEPPPTNENVNHHEEAEAAEMEEMKVKKKKKKKKTKVHECSICQRQFGSGQALGGHKRCHWITSNLNPNPNPDPDPGPGPMMVRVVRSSNNEDELALRLDLNVPTVASSIISNNHDEDHENNNDENNGGEIMENINGRDYEVDGMVKLAKLSELKDVIHGGGGDMAPWLQVGIGSTGYERL